MFFTVLFIILSNLIRSKYYAVIDMAHPVDGVFTRYSSYKRKDLKYEQKKKSKIIYAAYIIASNYINSMYYRNRKTKLCTNETNICREKNRGQYISCNCLWTVRIWIIF